MGVHGVLWRSPSCSEGWGRRKAGVRGWGPRRERARGSPDAGTKHCRDVERLGAARHLPVEGLMCGVSCAARPSARTPAPGESERQRGTERLNFLRVRFMT